jgi:hypothetical protein
MSRLDNRHDNTTVVRKIAVDKNAAAVNKAIEAVCGLCAIHRKCLLWFSQLSPISGDVLT